MSFQPELPMVRTSQTQEIVSSNTTEGTREKWRQKQQSLVLEKRWQNQEMGISRKGGLAGPWGKVDTVVCRVAAKVRGNDFQKETY